ncbi:MAG TPA: glycine oxidase ThiO [Pyrinomonadaceae bacterium]|nr:glycine oxidase ThiO [Pyrinomonadaceae bacterium]
MSFTPRATADVVIVGGGVIGLAIARALRQRGVRDVMLIERGQIGLEASWAAGGILGPQVEADRVDDFFQLACASRDMYPAFANALRAESGVDVELDMTGTLYLAFTQEEESVLRHRYDWQTTGGLGVELLSADEARALEPCISAKVRGALRFPNDIQVENRKLVEALAIASEKLGVRLVSDCEVRTVRVEQGKVRALETSRGVVSAPIFVLAAGAWTSLISSPDASLPAIEMEPVRGQMLCFKSDPPIARHVIYSSRGYLVPRRDGRVLAGSTAERVGFERSVTGEGMNAIKSMALEIAPVIGSLPLVSSWAGFRPCAADGLPVLGPCEGIKGLFYATGHYRNGILLAPITGELIAKAIINDESSSLLRPFSPDRVACQKPDREGGHVALADARASDTTGF